MKKSNLKTGMVVETANRQKYFVLACNLICKNGYVLLSSYDEDLKCRSNPDYDIIKIFGINCNLVCDMDSIFYRGNLVLLWKRKPEIIELTLEDIAEKFNVDVNSIKIKK